MIRPTTRPTSRRLRLTPTSVAIAFINAIGNGYNSGGGDLTVAGTVSTGADIAIVGVHQFDSNNIVNVTWNGTNMTLIGTVQKQASSNDWVSAYYLLAPAIGSFNLVVDRADSNRNQAVGAAYSGALQSGQPDASTGSSQAANTSASSSVASVANNCWHFFLLCEYVGGATGTVNATVRSENNGNGGIHLFDSNAPKTPAGALTQTATFSSSSSMWKQFTIQPSVAAGPTTVKTWDGVTQATGVKTYLGASLASTKSVIGAS